MSMWVGETEKQITAAFAEARDRGAFLVSDEADSLLSDRRFAERSREVSQVNEMPTWMESHPAPFACTTNYGERLDPATLRRFVFKVTLDYFAGAEQLYRSRTCALQREWRCPNRDSPPEPLTDRQRRAHHVERDAPERENVEDIR